MSFSYLAAAYFAFFLIMAWDWLGPRLRLETARRAILGRLRREAARKSA
ncbi:hypothetical protein [Arenimonas sp.]